MNKFASIILIMLDIVSQQYIDPAGSIWIDIYKFVNNMWILQDPNLHVSDYIKYGSCRMHTYRYGDYTWIGQDP